MFVCRPLSYTDADVVLVCFSISNPISFQNVRDKWKPEVSHFCPHVPVVLVGLKKDLRTNGADGQQLKSVSAEEAHQMASSIGAIDYMECSAKTGECVDDVFVAAAKASLVKKRSPLGKFLTKCQLI